MSERGTAPGDVSDISPVTDFLDDRVELVEGAEADKLARALKVRSAPVGVSIAGGLVVAKGYVNSVGQIRYLHDELEGRATRGRVTQDR